MFDSWVNFADGFILVYAIDDMESFEKLQPRLDRIKKIKGTLKNCIIVGNKCDLEESRQVQKTEVEVFSRNNNVPFIEASALVNNFVK